MACLYLAQRTNIEISSIHLAATCKTFLRFFLSSIPSNFCISISQHTKNDAQNSKQLRTSVYSSQLFFIYLKSLSSLFELLIHSKQFCTTVQFWQVLSDDKQKVFCQKLSPF
uniref:Uncharacterized protein n=1 Tax=Opuntia streptacantha TaxID=393608 RepID=A0A7C9CJ25_OPUST